MTCPKCGTDNPEGNRFCMKCGADLTAPVEAGVGSGGSQGQTAYAPPSNQGYTPGYTPGGSTGYTPSYAGVGAMTGVGEHVGFGLRFVAYLIDIILLAIVGGILNAIHLGGLTTIVDIVYFVYFWSTTGQTVGMMPFKLKVVRVDGQPLSWSTGILRYVGLIISTIPIFLGLFWVIWDPQKQGWHDKIASTYVTRTA